MDTYITLTSNVGRSLNEVVLDKIRKYRADYNNNPPMSSLLCLLLLVRLGGHTVNLCDFYFYMLIGKLTAFSQLQEFSLHNQTVDFSTTVVWCSRTSWNQRLTIFLLRMWHYGLFWILTIIDDVPATSRSHSPITLQNISFINLVSIFRCSSPPCNPVYVDV